MAASHLLQILKTAETERGALPNPVLKTLNDRDPEALFSFLREALERPLATGAKLNAIEWIKNAAIKLNLQEKDAAFEILKKFTEGKLEIGIKVEFCNAAYIAMGQVDSAKSKDFLRNAFNQAQKLRIPLKTQMSILKGLIASGVTPDDERLLVQLSHSRLTRFRLMSVRALNQLEKSSWQRLADMAKLDPDEDVRLRAMRALVNVDAVNAHRVLIELRETESEERVKNSISSLINRCNESNLESAVPSEPPSPSTISELKSSDHRVRRKAVKALGKSKHESAVAPLCDALKDENGIVRATAAEALGTISNNESLFPLIEVLENDSYHHARAAAAKALGQFRDKRIVDALQKGLYDRSGEVKKWCLRSINKWTANQFSTN